MEKAEQFVKYNCGNLLTGCYLFCLRGFYQGGAWQDANYCGISRGSGRPPPDNQEKVSFKVYESQGVGELAKFRFWSSRCAVGPESAFLRSSW